MHHKFFAKPTEVDGIKFSSLKESRYYQELKLRQKAGEVLFFLRQVPFALPGNTKYLLDFMVFLADGTVECVEVKGYMTDMGKLKLKQVEDLYPISIIIV